MSSSTLIKELREKTGAGFMDCKTALQHCQNDFEKAVSYLREKGLAAALKKRDRVASQGTIHSYIHGNGKIGVLVEVNCETDFVAKTPEFQSFVHDVAMHIAAANPLFLDRESVPCTVLENERAICRSQAIESGKGGSILDKIVEGKLKKFFEDACLLHQPFIKIPEKSIEVILRENIAKIGENIVIRRFARFQLGEVVKEAAQFIG